MPDEAPPSQPEPTPPLRRESSSPISDPDKPRAPAPAQPPPARRHPPPPLRRESSSPISAPAAIFIAAATLFAIFINSQNVGPILMLGVIALLLELRLRPRD